MRASGFLFLLEQGLCGICLMSVLSAALGLPRASRGRRLLFAILYAGFTLLSLFVPPLLQVVMVLPLTGLLALIGRFPARRTLPFCLTMLMMQWGCAGLSALLPLPGAVQTALTCTLLLLLRRHSRTRMEVSLDEPLKTDWDGNELLLSDVLGTDPDMVSRGIEESAERQMLFAALSHLSPREQQIMDLRFGLHGHPEMTQKEVADILGISQSYISRLEKRILHRLHGELVREEGYA